MLQQILQTEQRVIQVINMTVSNEVSVHRLGEARVISRVQYFSMCRLARLSASLGPLPIRWADRSEYHAFDLK